MLFRLTPVVAFAITVVGGVGGGGCTLPGQPGPDEIARAQQAIINGVPSTAEDDAAILIPLFQGNQFVGTCSGVLIAPNLVLTARHCVSSTTPGAAIACTPDGMSVTGGAVLSDRKATEIGVITGTAIKGSLDASGMQIFTTGATNLCNNDVGLVLLDTALTGVPFAQIRLQAPPVVGETFRAVGWGFSNNSKGFSRRQRDNVPVQRVGPSQDDNGITGIGPNELEVGESICEGDSGGPAFDETTRAVIGVVSRGGNGKMATSADPPYVTCVDSAGFTTQNIYTRVDGFADLFAQAFAAAGTDPWIEGGPDPRKAKTGDACMSNDDCRSAICVNPTNKGYCTQTCDATPGSCPDPMTCKKSGDLQICKLPSHGCAISPGAVGEGGTALGLFLFGLALVVARRRVGARIALT